MKVFVERTEEYPVYWAREERQWVGDEEVDVSPEDFVDYQRTVAEWNAWQQRLHDLCGDA